VRIGASVESWLNRSIVAPGTFAPTFDLSLNLNHAWKLGEAAGIAKADSVGTTTLTDWGSDDVASSATAKDGNAIHATIHQTQGLRNITVRTNLDTSAGRTWSVWISPGTSVGTVFARGRFPPFEYEYAVDIGSPTSGGDYRINAYRYDTSNNSVVTSYSNASLVFNSYVHLFIGYDTDKTVRLAVNGVLVSTSSVLAGTPRVDNTLSNLYVISGAFGPDNSIGNKIDELTTWTEAFDVGKAAYLYNSGAGRFYPF
jgi:hypothetical protein